MRPPTLATAPSVPNWRAWILPAAAALQFVLFVWFLARTAIRAPFMDMLAWLVAYLYFQDHGGLAAYLWAFHNEHHLVWIRLLTMADVTLTHGSGLVFIAAGSVALLAAATMAGCAFRRDLPDAAWLAPMLLLTSANAVDCGIPINTVYPIALVCMIAAVVLLASDCPWRRALALPVAAAAAFGNGAGLVIWRVLVWMSFRQRIGLIGIAATALVGIVFAAAYTHDMPSTTPLADAWRADPLASGDLAKLADYFLAYLGLPFTRAPILATPGRLFGFALCMAGIVAVAKVSLIERLNTPLNRFAAALILLTLGSATMAAIGRAHLEEEVKIPVRYAVTVAPLHIGLLCLVLPRLTGRARPIVVNGLAATLLVMQIFVGRSATRVSDEMRAAISAYDRGDRDPGVVRFIYSDPASAERLTAILHDRGLLRRD